MPTGAGTMGMPDASSLEPYVAVAESLHRRHRIRLAGGPPFFLGLRIARDADVAGNLVVEGSYVFVSNGPVVAAPVLALHPEIGRQEPREVGEVVQRRAADAPSGLRGVAHRVLAFEKDRRAGRFDPTAPDLGTDEIGKLPIGAGIQQDDLLARLRQHGRIDRTGSTGPNDDDVYFFVSHLTTSFPVGYAAYRGRLTPRILPSSRRRRRRHPRAARHRPLHPTSPSSPRSCSAACDRQIRADPWPTKARILVRTICDCFRRS